ncbi:MAG: hypothetical protein BVN28_02445 [Nitrospira sp. ST-bin4]|nr:MAG: hypothetical protein BVN28_02445 [Nitrospira sp. ST-bin4]
MITPKSQIAQHTLAAMMLFLVLGALAMIWPGIIALILGVFLLVQSFAAEQEIAILTWAEVSNWPIVFTSLRRFGSPAIFA